MKKVLKEITFYTCFDQYQVRDGRHRFEPNISVGVEFTRKNDDGRDFNLYERISPRQFERLMSVVQTYHKAQTHADEAFIDCDQLVMCFKLY